MSRVIVTGGRHWGEGKDGDEGYAACMRKLSATLGPLKPTLIVQGGCATGADYLARLWASNYGVECLTFPADWRRYGPSAGPRRNTEMVAAGAEYVVACPGGNGTSDCVRKAKAAALTVIEIGRNS